MKSKLSKKKGKVGVLIENHFDETEFHKFNNFFPTNEYDVEYISHLWHQKQLTFMGNNMMTEVQVTTEVSNIEPTDYKGIILIGAYAMDRLRYEVNPQKDQPNRAPAVEFLRKAVKEMDMGKLRIGAICHSLWLFCAAPELLKGREVTCAHNLICDVQNAGGIVVYDDNGTKAVHVDGNLITSKHPDTVDQFLNVFLEEICKQDLQTVL